jgi:hypothetical protein
LTQTDFVTTEAGSQLVEDFVLIGFNPALDKLIKADDKMLLQIWLQFN